MRIADMPGLMRCLAQAQEQRKDEVRLELTQAFTARVTDAELVQALTEGLPMAQGIRHRIVRSRGLGARVTAKLRYREGVRILEHLRGRAVELTQRELRTLERAREIAEGRDFPAAYAWVCRHVRYENTAPGQKGYERLVGASGALLEGRANCQGFADAVCLLGGLCGAEIRLKCGRGERLMHVWSEVRQGDAWRVCDASREARQIKG